MNDERRKTLERLFDGEPVFDDPRDEADDAESLAYLRRLSLLRELALRHDPAAAVPSRRPVLIHPRSRRRTFATVLALAASVLFMAVMVHYARLADPVPASIPAAPAWPAAGTSIADARIASPRSPRPPLEVELYRWANESSPYPDDAAGVALSRFGSLEGRHASREILTLELANSMPGPAVNFPRSVASRASSSSGTLRRFGSSRRHRPSLSPRA
ncbi:MAG: hypothetical protein ACHRXM_08105 [Isosphaerales bacterium]